MPRKGKKRSDRRWIDGDGNVWASKLEFNVFDALRQDERLIVRRCSKEQGDTFSYFSPVRSAECLACSSGDVVQRRTYTPDVYVIPAAQGPHGRGYYLEVKGHFPGPKRSLLRHFLKTGPSIDLRLAFDPRSYNARATSKLSMWEYVDTFLKIPHCAWTGALPESWYD